MIILGVLRKERHSPGRGVPSKRARPAHEEQVLVLPFAQSGGAGGLGAGSNKQ